MKKIIALLLTMMMFASLTVGCGKTGTPTATKDNPLDLTMWCIATESDSNRHAYEASIADFKAAHPEINLTWEATENEQYKTKIKAAVAASSKNPEVAAESAFELAKGICNYGYLDGNGLPAWTQDPNGDYSSINPLTQTVAEIVANSSQMVLFGDTAMPADNANTYLDYVSQIYVSAIDGKAFVDGLVKDIK